MESDRIIRIEDETFKIIMNKLDRIDEYVRQVTPIIKEYSEYKKNNPAEKRLLDKDEAAKLLGVHPRTLHRYRKDNKIPCLQKGGPVLYDYDVLVDYKYNKENKNTHTNFVSTILSSITKSKKKA